MSIEAADTIPEAFWEWCREQGFNMRPDFPVEAEEAE